MNEAIAREILATWIQADDCLYDGVRFMDWQTGDDRARLDAYFSADELEAIAWWMLNKGQQK